MLMVVTIGMNVWADSAEDKMKHARRYGAEAHIVLRCVDQDGGIVTNAHVSAGLYPDGSFENALCFNSYTDTNGVFVLKGKTNGEFTYEMKKNGYYTTREQKFLFKLPDVSVARGRWQPYGMTNTVVLKRMINPVAMHVHQGTDRLAVPKRDEWTGFDLEHADWVAPYGKGKREDFQVFFRVDVTSASGGFSKFALTLRFPKPFDGMYLMEKDNRGSVFQTIYEADTNRVYDSERTFTYERGMDEEKRKAVTQDHLLKENEYLVLRVRSETDKDGKLIKANYAKLYAPIFAAKYGFLITSYFNPEENSPSLEADTTKNLLTTRGGNFAP